VGPGVEGVAVGDEVVGWSEERSSQAEYVAVPATQVVTKPAPVSWEAAGGTYVAAGAAWACVTAVNAQHGETVVVSGAAGGVGSLAVQLLHARGAHVVALASPANQEFLESLHAVFVDYLPREGLADRITAAAGETGVDAWIDVYGGGYVQLAVDMGISPQRINTIIDFAAAAELGAQALGTHDVTDAAVLAEILAMEADGRLRIPIAAAYPLEQVREAQTELAERHTRGKIVLLP
jgi:NADPH:quinone reductase-like Zn-dependent oxidoreductase